MLQLRKVELMLAALDVNVNLIKLTKATNIFIADTTARDGGSTGNAGAIPSGLPNTLFSAYPHSTYHRY